MRGPGPARRRSWRTDAACCVHNQTATERIFAVAAPLRRPPAMLLSTDPGAEVRCSAFNQDGRCMLRRCRCALGHRPRSRVGIGTPKGFATFACQPFAKDAAGTKFTVVAVELIFDSPLVCIFRFSSGRLVSAQRKIKSMKSIDWRRQPITCTEIKSVRCDDCLLGCDALQIALVCRDDDAGGPHVLRLVNGKDPDATPVARVFDTAIVAVKLNRQRIVVVEARRITVLDTRTAAVLHTIDSTPPNVHGAATSSVHAPR